MLEPFKLLFLSLLCLFLGEIAYAQEPGTPSPYEVAHNQVLELNAQNLNPEVQLYNLAVVDAQHGQYALALARLRHALYLRPTFTESRKALHWVAEEARMEAVLEAGTFMERLRKVAWAYVPTWLYPVALWICLVAGLWKLLHWIEVARQNRAQSLPAPAPSWFAITLLTLSLPFALLWGLQTWDRSFTERATFLGEAGLRAGPSIEAPETAPVRLGAEVLVLREHNDWRLIARPGATAGWVPASDLYVTSRSFHPGK